MKYKKLSEHFSEDEFDCYCCGEGGNKISPILIRELEKLREECGNYPLYINSGYRCPRHNWEVGGATNSQHVQGTAADVARPQELTFAEFKAAVFRCDFDGVGLYPHQDFIHVDVRDGAQGPYYLW